MQTTSALWKSLWAGGNARLETKAVIAGTDYTQISTPEISRALMQGQCSIGNAVSATCKFSVITSNTIPRSAKVVIKMRLTDGTNASEWLNAGTFYVSHRTKDPVSGVITLECYDSLLMANSDMPRYVPWTDHNGNIILDSSNGNPIMVSMQYPCSMSAALDLILYYLDISLDSRTTILTGDAYTIDSVDSGTKMSDVLKKIAAANGGNWVMTPDNELRLVPLLSAANAASATEDVIDVVAILSHIDVIGSGTITGIRYPYRDMQYIAGTDTGIVLDADVNPTVAQALLTTLNGRTYQSYNLQKAIYDPAVEIGDYVRAGENSEVAAVLCVESASLGIAFRGDISAPETGEIADEYPYVGGSAKVLSSAKSYATELTQALDQSLNQEGIVDRITNNGEATGIGLNGNQVVFNADYITAGTLDADRIGANTITAEKLAAGSISADLIQTGEMSADRISGGTLTLGGLNNADGVLQIVDWQGNAIGTWDSSGLHITAGSININDNTFSVDENGHLTAQSANLNGDFSVSVLYPPDGMEYDAEHDIWVAVEQEEFKVEFSENGLKFYRDGEMCGAIEMSFYSYFEFTEGGSIGFPYVSMRLAGGAGLILGEVDPALDPALVITPEGRILHYQLDDSIAGYTGDYTNNEGNTFHIVDGRIMDIT